MHSSNPAEAELGEADALVRTGGSPQRACNNGVSSSARRAAACSLGLLSLAALSAFFVFRAERPLQAAKSHAAAPTPDNFRQMADEGLWANNTGRARGLGAQGFFLMCPGPYKCGQQQQRAWSVNPAALVNRVGPALATVPGIPDAVYETVAAKWEASPPAFKGRAVGLEDIASFIRQLLTSDPFGTGSSVPYVNLRSPAGPKVVAVTQRQLAFVVANVLMGNNIAGGNGLTAAIRHCSSAGAKDFIFSILSLLAVLSQELAGGQQGNTLIGATPKAADDSWKARLNSYTLQEPQVMRAATGGGPDFMSGGVQGQSLTDIAGTDVGGGALLCSLADSQDESLVQFYSEVLTFVFFVGPGQMLPVPWTLLGARRYMSDIFGESTKSGPIRNRCGAIRQNDWLNQDIAQNLVSAQLQSQAVTVPASSFVAVASKSSAAAAGGSCPLYMAVNNNCTTQRHHFEADISLWYQAYEPSMYLPVMQNAFRFVVKRAGTGPWGAGVWYGDSQQYFLAVWLATSLLGSIGLDYYVYDHFCENPGNQCFVLGADGCASCITQSGSQAVKPQRCGTASLHDMTAHFTGQPTKALYLALRDVAGPPAQVFDAVAGYTPSQAALAQPVTPAWTPPAPAAPGFQAPVPGAWPAPAPPPPAFPVPVPVPAPAPPTAYTVPAPPPPVAAYTPVAMQVAAPPAPAPMPAPAVVPTVAPAAPAPAWNGAPAAPSWNGVPVYRQ